jgi:TPR repeat protein
MPYAVLVFILCASCASVQELAIEQRSEALERSERLEARQVEAVKQKEAAARKECESDPGESRTDGGKCCEWGDARWCIALGRSRLVRPEARLAFLDRACELGEIKGCAMLGLDEALATLAPDKAREGLRRACDARIGAACDQLGVAMAKGKLGTPAPQDEFALAKMVCDAGRTWLKTPVENHHYACVLYGNALWDGHAVDPNKPLAADILIESCKDPTLPRELRAQCYVRLGRAARAGEVKGTDLVAAAQFLDRACDLSEDAATCLESAQTCDDALYGYERDGDNEPACYASACERGSAEACKTMGGYFDASEQWEKAGKAYGAAVALGMESVRPRLLEVAVSGVLKARESG